MAKRKKISFHERYKTGQTPWEIDRVDANLVALIDRSDIQPCRVLDIGCGTGDNSIWFAGRGFEVTGCDTTLQAIETAMEKSKKANTACSFFQADFLEEATDRPHYSLLFDRGCFHCFTEPEQRIQFVQNCYSHLKRDGLWISLIGNCDETRQETGPPQMSATEIAVVVEPFFEILLIEAGRFDSKLDTPPKSWLCLFRKRSIDSAQGAG